MRAYSLRERNYLIINERKGEKTVVDARLLNCFKSKKTCFLQLSLWSNTLKLKRHANDANGSNQTAHNCINSHWFPV